MSPSSTSWPTSHSIFHTVPVMCASTSGGFPPGSLAVAAPWSVGVPPVARAPRSLEGKSRRHHRRRARHRPRRPAALARKGARVGIGDIDPEAARTIGSGARAYELDVTDTTSFEDFFDRVEADLGPLDVMINNAGILHLGPFVDEDEASQARQVDINLRPDERHQAGPCGRCCRAAQAHRQRRLFGQEAHAARNRDLPATKHGVVGFPEAVRWEQRGSSRLLDRHARGRADGDDRRLQGRPRCSGHRPRGRSHGDRRSALSIHVWRCSSRGRSAGSGRYSSSFRGARAEAVLRAMKVDR